MSKWEWKKLKDICEKGSSNIKQSDLKDLTGDYPIFGASGYIQNVDFYQRDRDYIGIIKDGSGVGRTMLLPAFSSVIGTLQYILPKEGNDIKFINYALQNIDFSKSVQGAAIPHIYFKDYGETEILVPPLLEQKRIVKILDEEFSKIETLKTNAETNLKNAKELFETTLEKELNPLSRHSECSEESSAKLPSGWEWKTLQEISNVYGEYGLSVPSTSYNGIRYLRITDITDDGRLNDEYVSADIEKIEESDKLQEGDILFARTGATVGKTLIFKEDYGCCVFAGYLIRYRPKKEVVLPFYLHYVTHSKSYFDWVKKSQKAAAQPNISAKLYNAFQIPLPPLSVQKEIVARLDKLSENVKRLEANYKQIIANCDELKKSILKKTFEGGS